MKTIQSVVNYVFKTAKTTAIDTGSIAICSRVFRSTPIWATAKAIFPAVAASIVISALTGYAVTRLTGSTRSLTAATTTTTPAHPTIVRCANNVAFFGSLYVFGVVSAPVAICTACIFILTDVIISRQTQNSGIQQLSPTSL